jgi:hypothetical protein
MYFFAQQNSQLGTAHDAKNLQPKHKKIYILPQLFCHQILQNKYVCLNSEVGLLFGKVASLGLLDWHFKVLYLCK